MRAKGSRNKGFWFRTSRGWYADNEKLCDPDGNHIKDQADKQAAELAYHTRMAQAPVKGPRAKGPESSTYTVREVCRKYLEVAKGQAAQTYILRKRFLYDFCEGKRDVHKGYGNLPIGDLIGLHVKEWLDAHSKWHGCRRMAYQAVRRAIHWGMKMGMVKENPIKGFPIDPVRRRQAYFTKEVEQTIYETANKALADVIRALIGTGCRPGEVARLEWRHIEDQDGRMVWRFKPEEHKTGSKTHRDRVVPVNSEIAAIVKSKRRNSRRVFLNSKGKPWTPTGLKSAFARLRKQLAKKGVKLTTDQTMYAARHTYAKRQMGKGISTNVLAAQMGNSPQIAWEHYGRDWDLQADNSAILWSGID